MRLLRRFVRDNAADATVMRDLAVLAGEDPQEVAPDFQAAKAPGAEFVELMGIDDPSAAALFDDEFTRTFVRTTTHVKRYFPFYAGGAVWVMVMALIQPLDSRGQDGASFEGAQPRSGSADLASNATGAAVPESSDVAFGGAIFSGSEPVAFDTGGTDPYASFGGGFSTEGDGSFDDSSASSPGELGDFASELEDREAPLRIVKSGYSSRTGGTPLEQAPPSNGLPVGAVGGQATKRSFIAVTGTEPVLRLREVTHSSNVGNTTAVVRACAVETEDWAATRGQSFANEPTWSTPCVTGTRDATGVWTFDFSMFDTAPADLPGLALTPGPDAAPFNLTFEPSAVTGS